VLSRTARCDRALTVVIPVIERPHSGYSGDRVGGVGGSRALSADRALDNGGHFGQSACIEGLSERRCISAKRRSSAAVISCLILVLVGCSSTGNGAALTEPTPVTTDSSPTTPTPNATSTETMPPCMSWPKQSLPTAQNSGAITAFDILIFPEGVNGTVTNDPTPPDLHAAFVAATQLVSPLPALLEQSCCESGVGLRIKFANGEHAFDGPCEMPESVTAAMQLVYDAYLAQAAG